MRELKLNAENRDSLGTGASHRDRQEGMVPAVVYGAGEENLHIRLPLKEFKAVDRQATAATILGLVVDGDEKPVLIKDIQTEPVSGELLHVDLQLVDMSRPIRVTIPIVLTNRDSIKVQPSILTQLLDEIEIEALPNDLPDGDIEVDVSDMEIGDNISVEELEIAKDEKITVLRDMDDTVASLSEFVEVTEEELEEDVDLDMEPELVSDSDEDEEADEEETEEE